jgi:hypothetical protein
LAKATTTLVKTKFARQTRKNPFNNSLSILVQKFLVKPFLTVCEGSRAAKTATPLTTADKTASRLEQTEDIKPFPPVQRAADS